MSVGREGSCHMWSLAPLHTQLVETHSEQPWPSAHPPAFSGFQANQGKELWDSGGDEGVLG